MRNEPQITFHDKNNADPAGSYDAIMIALIITLLVIWLILVVVGLTIKGLFWLFVVGLILFIVTGIFGWIRRRV